jgi:hypothetical protein
LGVPARILQYLKKILNDKAIRKPGVSQFVIPAKPRETGREPGSRSPRDDAISLDSGFYPPLADSLCRAPLVRNDGFGVL